MTNLFAAVFWLIATLINTGGDDDSLRSLQATDGNAEAVRQVELLPGLLRVAKIGLSEERTSGVELYSTGPTESYGSLDVLPALPAATVYSIPVHGLSNDGTVVPPTPTPSLVATMEAESPKTLSITDIICSFSWPCWEAISVARCESGLNPYAENPSGAQGLFQMMRQYHTWRYHGGNWYDPWTNISAAYSLWAETGSWHHWVCKP